VKAAFRNLAIGIVLFTFTSLIFAQGTFVLDNTGNANSSPTAASGGLFFIDTGTGPGPLNPGVYPSLNATVYAGGSRADALANGFCYTFTWGEALLGIDNGLYADLLGNTLTAHNVPPCGATTIVLQVWLGGRLRTLQHRQQAIILRKRHSLTPQEVARGPGPPH
jgi:hypothetical protein